MTSGDVGTASRRSARIAGVVLLLAAAAIGAEATTFNVAFVTDAIGPKALPLLAALILGAAGLMLALRPDVDVQWAERGPAGRIVGALCSFLLYAALLPWIGFFTSTTAVVATLSTLYGAHRGRAVIVAAALSGVLWVLFVAVLGLPLPIGDVWMR